MQATFTYTFVRHSSQRSATAIYRYVLVVSHAGEAMATERDPAKGNKKINTIIVITWRSVHGKPMQMSGVLDFIYFLFRSFA